MVAARVSVQSHNPTGPAATVVKTLDDQTTLRLTAVLPLYLLQMSSISKTKQVQVSQIDLTTGW
jgi:hypothetical protein